METDLRLQISQHQAHLKHENFNSISQLAHITTAKHFAATATFKLYTSQHQQFEVYKN